MPAEFKRFFEANYFFANVLLPALALAIYCGSFAYLSTRLQIEGVNYYFASKLGTYLLLGVAASTVVFFILLKTSRSRGANSRNGESQLHLGDLTLLLLPLTPVLQYVINNQDILSRVDILYIILLFAIFASLYIFTLPFLLRRVFPTQTLMIAGVAFVFTIASMASVSDYFAWFEQGALRKQLMVLGGVFALLWLFYAFGQRKILYLFLVLNIVTNSAMQGSQKRASDMPALSAQENKLFSLVSAKTPASTPNVYLLLYDAYVPNETMLGYGIDNSAQETYLQEQAFKLYPHTYSIGSSTIATMSRVLNASAEYYGDKRRALSGDGIAQNIFRNLGYETYGLFPTDYFFRGIGASYDYAIPADPVPSYVQLSKGVFMGEFRFNIEDVGYNQLPHEQFVQAKQTVFSTVSQQQVFVYMHSNLPSHSQNSGACRTNETNLFRERLKKANVEMRQDVDLILQQDPGAIVIVAGDHGPYLTKNCSATTDVYGASEISRLDIQDRFGSFLAIRWPSNDFEAYDEITVLQDLFPVLLAYVYKDPDILRSKIEPRIPIPNSVSGVSVMDGTIQGGLDDGEPLYTTGK